MISFVYGDTDPVLAYLFQGDDISLLAVSLDKSGRNIPRSSCPEGWRLKAEFPLAVAEPVPAAITAVSIIRGVRALGYYIWREGTPIAMLPCGSHAPSTPNGVA
jgi:hypothetical protein